MELWELTSIISVGWSPCLYPPHCCVPDRKLFNALQLKGRPSDLQPWFVDKQSRPAGQSCWQGCRIPPTAVWHVKLCIVRWSKEVILPLGVVSVHLEYCVQFRAHSIKGMLTSLKESRRGHKTGSRTKGMACEEMVRILVLLSLEKRRSRGDLIAFCSTLRMGSRGRCQALLLVTNGRREMAQICTREQSSWTLGKMSKRYRWCTVANSIQETFRQSPQ